MDFDDEKTKLLTVLVLLITGFLIGLICDCFRTVEPGHIGVRVKFGKVDETYLSPGLNTKTPFVEKIIQINKQMKSVEKSNEVLTMDLQPINAIGSLSYSLNDPLIPKMYENIGEREMLEHAIILPAIQESFKSATSNFTAENLVKQREVCKLEILKSIEEFISISSEHKELDGLIQINNFAITDFRFSAQFTDSIEQKVKAEQDAEKALQEKERQITEAEAILESNKLKADADAYKIEKEADARAYEQQAQANASAFALRTNADAKAYEIGEISQAKKDAIDLEGASITTYPDLVKLRIAESWDGVMPKVTWGGTPLLDVSDLD